MGHTTKMGSGRSVAARRTHALPGGTVGSSDYYTRDKRARCCSAWSLGEIKRRPTDQGHSYHAATVGLELAVSLVG